jgi:hemerythrin superfamily protein
MALGVETSGTNAAQLALLGGNKPPLKDAPIMDVKTTLKSASDKLAGAFSTDKAPDETDVLDTLKKEHDEVQELLAKLVDSDKAAERKSLLARVKAALVPHSKAEEKIVYDAVIAARSSTKDKNKIDGAEGYLEHAIAAQTLLKLDKITPATSPEFTAHAKVLKELIDHHVQEEERNIWSDVKESFDSDDRKAMNLRYLAAKKKVKIP